MSSIDNRIVQMQFENSQFEKGVKESLKSLENLKKGLNLDASTKSLQELQKAGDSFSLARIADGVESLASRFSVLGTIGGTVLENLTNKAMGLASQMTSTVKQLTIAPVSEGWNKYEDKTTAVATILAAVRNQGKGMDDVNAALDKLAWFTDETSYAFVDMTSNIGKFTAQGVDLDDAVTAMQGISTWASISGQGVNEAGRAMYNLSQALGVGAVKLQDWKSIENANMATQEFKQTAIETAKALGVLTKEGKTKSGKKVTAENFSQTLQYGWFNKDVLLQTLSTYGSYADQVYQYVQEHGGTAAEAMEALGLDTESLGARAFRAAQEAKTLSEAIDSVKEAAQTGWTTTWEMIFGNYEEAKALWTDITEYLYEIFVESASTRNDILQLWKDSGGRDDFVSGLIDTLSALTDIIKTVRSTVADIFPVVTVDNLLNVSTYIKNIGATLKEIFGIKQKELIPTSALSTVVKTKKEIVELAASFGVFGEDSWKEITKVTSSLESLSNELSRGSKGEAVKKMQKRLQELGYDIGSTGADGIFGPKTEAALKKFEEEAGLTVDGIYDEATHKALGDALGLNKKVVIGYQLEQVYEDEYSSTGEKFISIVKGATAVVHIFATAVSFVFKVVGHVITLLSPLWNAILTIAAAFGDALVALDEFLTSSGLLDSWFESLKNFFAPIGDWATEAGNSLLQFFGLAESGAEDADSIITLPKLWENLKKSIADSGVIKTVTEAFNNFKAAIKSTTDKLKGNWKTFKKTLGDKFTSMLSGIPGVISKVISALGNLVAGGFNLLTPIIQKIPDFVKKISDFWSALTYEGDPQVGKAPGFLIKVRDGLKSVFETLFGSGDEATGKLPGLFKRLGKLFSGDFAGFTEGMNEEDQQKVIETLEGVTTFVSTVRECASILTGGKDADEAAVATKEMAVKMEEVREGVVTAVATGRMLVTGTAEEDSPLSEKAKAKILEIRDGIISVVQAIGDFISAIGEFVGRIFGKTDYSDSKLSEGAVKGIEDFRKGIGRIISAIGLFIGGNMFKNGKGLDSKTKFNILKVRRSIVNVFNSIGDAVTNIWNAIKGFITGDFTDFVKGVPGAVSSGLKTAFESVRDFILTAAEVIGRLFGKNDYADSKLSDDAVSKIENFRKGVGKVFDAIKYLITGTLSDDSSLSDDTISTLTDIRDWFIEAFATIGDTATNIWNAITGFITGDFTEFVKGIPGTVSDGVTTAFEGVRDFILTVVEVIGRLFGKTDYGESRLSDGAISNIENFRKGVGKVISAIQLLFSGNAIKDGKGLDADTKLNLLNVRKGIVGVFNTIGDIATGIWNAIRGFITGDFTDFLNGIPENVQNGVKQAFENVRNFILTVAEVVGRLFGKTDYEDSKLSSDAIEKINKFREGIGKVFDAIKLLITGNVSDETKLSDQSITNITAIRDMIVGVFQTIADTFGNLWETVKGIFSGKITFSSIGDFLASLWTGITDFVSKLTGIVNDKTAKISGGFFDTLKKFFEGFGKIIKKYGMWIAIGYVVYKLIAFISNLTGAIKQAKKKTSFTTELIKFAVALAIVAAAVYALAKLPYQDMWRGLAAVVILMGLMAAITFVLGKFGGKKMGAAMATAGQGVLQFGLGILALAAAIWLLALLDENQLKTGGLRMIALLVLIAGFIVAINALKANYVSIKGLWEIAATIGLLALIATLISLVPAKMFWTGLVRLIAIMVLLGAFMAVLGKMKATKIKMDGLWQVALVIAVMGLVLAGLSLLSWDQFAVGVVGLIAIMALLTVFVAVVGKVGKSNIKLKGFLSLALVIAVLGIVFAVIANMEWDQMWRGVIGVVAIMGLLIGLVYVMGKFGKDMKIAPMIVMFLGLAILIGVFGYVIDKIKDVDPLVMLSFSGSLLIALAAFVGACLVIGKIQNGPSSMIKGAAALGAAFVIIIAIVGILVWGIGKLNEVSGGNVKSCVEGGGEVLSSLGTALSSFTTALGLSGDEIVLLVAALAAFGTVNGLTGGVAGGGTVGMAASIAAGFAAIVGILGALSSGLGLLNEWTDGKLVELINSGAEVLGSIGGALGSFVGGISAGAQAEQDELQMNEMEQFASAISSVKEAVSGMSSEDDTFEDDLEAAKTQAQALHDFFAGLEGYDIIINSAFTSYTTAAGQLSTDMTLFAEAIGAFRDNIVGFSTYETVDEDKNKAVEMAQSLHDFFSDLEGYSVEGNELSGYYTAPGQLSIDMTKFALAIGTFASKLKTLQTKEGEESIESLTERAIAIAISVKSFFDDITAQMPAEDALGKYNARLDSLFSNITTLGATMSNYATEISGIANSTLEEDSAKAVDVASAIATFLSKVSNMNIEKNAQGISAWFGTNTRGQTVLADVKELGNAMAESKDAFSGLDESHISGVTNAIAMAKSVADFLIAIAPFSDEIHEGSWSSYDEVIGFFNAANIGENSFAAAIVGFVEGVMNELGNSSVSDPSSAISFISSVASLITAMTTVGSLAPEGATLPDIVGLVDNTLTTITGKQTEFVTAGTNFVYGLSEGASDVDAYTTAVQSATDVAQAMLDAVKLTFNEASPSKETEAMGRFFTLGLGIGVSKDADSAEESAGDVAQNMLDTASGTLATLSSLLSEGIDDTPVIKPVIDLTDARATAGTIGDLFNRPNIGVDTTTTFANMTNDLGAAGVNEIQNGSSAATEAITSLNTQFDSLKDTIANTTDTGVLDQIRALSDKFGSLADAVASMKLILDTGVLVGAISPAVDAQLGNIAGYKDRAN